MCTISKSYEDENNVYVCNRLEENIGNHFFRSKYRKSRFIISTKSEKFSTKTTIELLLIPKNKLVF